MGFEFEKLRVLPVEAEFKPNEQIVDGEGLKLQLNLDLLTVGKMEEVEAENRQREKDLTVLEAKQKNKSKKKEESISAFHFIKTDIRFKARQLGGKPGENNPADRYIADWDLVQNGAKVPVSYEIFEQMPLQLLNELYNFVVGEANSVKKTK